MAFRTRRGAAGFSPVHPPGGLPANSPPPPRAPEAPAEKAAFDEILPVEAFAMQSYIQVSGLERGYRSNACDRCRQRPEPQSEPGLFCG